MHARYSASKWRRCEDYRGGFSAFIKADMQLLSKDLLVQITTMMLRRGLCVPHLHTNKYKYKYNYKYKIMKIRVSQLNPVAEARALSSTLDFMPCHGLQSVYMPVTAKITVKKCLKLAFSFLVSVTKICNCHKMFG